MIMISQRERTARVRTTLRLSAVWSCVLLFALLQGSAALAQWTTSGNDINNTNAGKVGVGTTTPSAKLDVTFDGATTAGVKIFDTRVAGADFGGHLLFHGYSSGTSIEARFGQIGGLKENATSGNMLGYLGFYTNNGAGGLSMVERMRISSGGNVGIGTATPDRRLQVFAANPDQANTYVMSLFRGYNGPASSGTGYGTGLQFRDYNSVQAGIVALRTDVYNHYFSDLGFYVNGGGAYGSSSLQENSALIERMRIRSNGNVGIGTATPGYRLDVQGGALNASGGLCINGECKTAWSQVTGVGTQWTTAGSNIHYTAGSVGVGTTSPYAIFNVNQVAGAPKGVLISGDEYYQSGNGSAANGVLLLLGVNRPNNRQLWIGDNSTLGSATYGFFRYQTGTALPTMDGVTGNGLTRLPISLGTATTNVGVGFGETITGSPGSKLSVAGGAAVGVNYRNAASPANGLIVEGDVGIGTASPAAKFHIYNGGGKPRIGINIDSQGTQGYQQAELNLFTLGDGTRDVVTAGTKGWHLAARGNAYAGATEQNDLQLYSWDGTAIAIRQYWDSAGNVGIGTSNPTAKLDVNGDINVSGNINAKYQDIAEWVPTSEELSPGTVVVLDPARSNHVLASSSAYDTGVAGVVSARPGLILGERGEGKVMVATTGRVRVKVNAAKGAIKIGDLLVTSDVAGVAMKSEPLVMGGRKIHAPGTIIGKALEPLAGSVGEILVLLSLQ
jgi:hypothetical protein